MPPPKDPIKALAFAKKISDRAKERCKDPEYLLKMSNAATLCHSDPTWKQRQSETRKKLWQDPTFREKCVSNMKVAIQNPERNRKLGEAVKLAHADPTKSENYKQGYIKRSSNPDWIANHAAANEQRSDAMKGDKCHLWRGGVSFYPYCIKFNNKRKKAVRNFFNNTCICCGKHRDENTFRVKGGLVRPVELDVHHIDHDKEQGCNGKEFNLVPLCRECHLDEKHKEEEYKKYINKTLDAGFAFGIWSEEDYKISVMYLD